MMTSKPPLQSNVIAHNLKDPKKGVPIKSRRMKSGSHKKCFSGVDLVRWLLKNTDATDREEALDFGEFLRVRGVFLHVNDKYKKLEEKDTSYYKFNVRSGPESATYLDTAQKKFRSELPNWPENSIFSEGSSSSEPRSELSAKRSPYAERRLTLIQPIMPISDLLPPYPILDTDSSSSPMLGRRPVSMNPPIKTYAGKYFASKVLGEGSFGITYLAIDGATGRECVVKELKLGDEHDARKLELFQIEVSIVKKLGKMCRRIPEVYYSEKTFFVQEFVQGSSLDNAKGTLKTPEILKMIMYISEVIRYCHNEGILHRDVKPGNIIAKPDDEDGNLYYLIDFGIAKQLETGALSSNTVCGTPAYQAPEISSLGSTFASDLYSLGVSALHMLIDPRTVPDPRPAAVLEYLYTKKMIDSEFRYLLSKLIAFNPKDRFQTCQSIQDVCKTYAKWQKYPKHTAQSSYSRESPYITVKKGDDVAVADASRSVWVCICNGQLGYVPKDVFDKPGTRFDAALDEDTL